MVRQRKIDDPDIRARLLDLIRIGHGRYEAAETLGLSRASMRNWYRDDPEFRAEVEDAIDASIEPVLYKLRELAKDGDVSAANTYLKHVAPTPRAERDKRSTVEHQVKVSLNEISRIEELQAMLAERTNQRAAALPAAEEDWIEGEILD